MTKSKKKPQLISAEEIDRKFDAGEDITPYVDWSKAERPGAKRTKIYRQKTTGKAV